MINSHENRQHRESDPIKILIADDDEATRILLRAAITQWGYHVVEASQGEEAWSILQQPNPPHILILDWVMPTLDGISLCRRIDKELSFHPYIIFLTRMSGTENVIEGLEAGADEFLLKPFDVAELRVRIFAGERIIKYRSKLEEQSVELQEYVSKVNQLTEEQMKQRISFHDLSVILQGIHKELDVVVHKIHVNNPDVVPALQKIQELQTDLMHTMGLIKGFKSELRSEAVERVQNESDVIDMQRMQAFFGNDRAAIIDFIKTFVELSSEQMVKIDQSIEAKDEKSAKYYLHLLRGAAGNSGVMGMYDLCDKGEKSVDQGNWSEVSQCYQGVKVIMDQLRLIK